MRVVNLKLGLLSIMAGAVITTGIIGGNTASCVQAASFATSQESLVTPVTVHGGDTKLNMRLRNIELRDLLKMLSVRIGFNILLDESVTGLISVDLNDITVNQALETIKDYASLVYMQDDQTLVVSSKDSTLATSISQQISQMIPIKYVNARLISQLLNSTVFSGGKDGGKKASTEFRTNSVVIIGSDNDIRLANDMIALLDVPRETKTFKINHASVYEVAQLLKATVFNDGIAPYGGKTTKDGDISAESTPVSIITENFEEGSGSEEVSGASSEGGGGSEQTFTLRTKTIAQKDLNISPEGPVLIPDTRTSTLTIMGTIEQIALAEAVIPNLDQKLPQVAIETSLVEMSVSTDRSLDIMWGQQSGQWRTGFDNDYSSQNTAGAPYTGSTLIGLPDLRGQGNFGSNGGGIAFSTTPLSRNQDYLFQINSMISHDKAKLLANPTVMAVHNTEAIISITEEVVRSTQVTRDSTGFTQTQVEIGEAGIVLNILPKITGDDFIILRIRPSVSTIAGQVVDAQGNVTTLLRRKDFAVQEARVANGQTLALGGLIEETKNNVNSKVPGFADLPIIGALFRTSSNNGSRNELIMLVTPRLVDDDKPVISSSYNTNPSANISSQNNNSSSVNPKQLSNNDDVIEIAPVNTKTASSKIKQIEQKSTTEAYTLGSVMKEFGVENVDPNKSINYNESQIDNLINQYLPQGSK
ncbi:MAG: secretin N-terminal domain-containing protein [Vampirovibrionia bacterium]